MLVVKKTIKKVIELKPDFLEAYGGVTFTFTTDSHHLFKAGAWERGVGEGLGTRKEWIDWSEFAVLDPKFRTGKKNDKSLAISSYLKKINIIKSIWCQ
ncbi:MAG: hypothetical protein ACUZ8I_03530 [Candidatus Scalindua sp.]